MNLVIPNRKHRFNGSNKSLVIPYIKDYIDQMFWDWDVDDVHSSLATQLLISQTSTRGGLNVFISDNTFITPDQISNGSIGRRSVMTF